MNLEKLKEELTKKGWEIFRDFDFTIQCSKPSLILRLYFNSGEFMREYILETDSGTYYFDRVERSDMDDFFISLNKNLSNETNKGLERFYDEMGI